MLLCCLLLICFGTEVYAQGNSGNAHTQEYSDDEFQFEFEAELIYADDSDDGDDEGDDDSDDDSNDDDENEVVGVQIRVENSGTSTIDNDILFRAKIVEQAPQTVPDSYDAQETLYLLDEPLEPSNSKEVSVDLSEKRAGGKVVIIWPLVDSDNPEKTEHTPFITLNIPDTDIPENTTINEFIQIQIYPNPTTGILNIDVPYDASTNQITIYNESGQAIKTFNEDRKGMIQLDLQSLSQGIYFVAVRNKQKQTIHYSKLFILF